MTGVTSTLLAAALAALVLLPFVVLTISVTVGYALRSLYQGLETLPHSALVPLLARETVANWRIFLWTLLRQRGGEPLRSGRTVVLVHGLAADGCSMRALGEALDRAGRATASPHLGRMFRPIERYADHLERAIDHALARQAHSGVEGIDVVAHSLGGIVLRACLARRPDLAAQVKNVVSIAAPHAGSGIARNLPLPEARQLFIGAPYLATLPTLRTLAPHARITSIASKHDAIVYPMETSRVEGADTHELAHVGHAELLVHAGVADLVVAAVA